MKGLNTVVAAAKTYAHFESAFTAPEGTTTQDHLEEYKEKNISTKLGKDAVNLIYDVLGGEHDDVLAEVLKPQGEWAKLVDWRLCNIAEWSEMARQLSLQGSVSVDVSKPPSSSAPRALARSLSNASDDAREEQRKKESERDRLWAAATATRRKLVNFQSPRSWKAKDLDAAYEASSAYAWDGGKATENHRVFIFSADLIHESGNAWARTSEWHASYGEECVKFMQSKKGHADLLVFCDGRSRNCRKALESLNESTRNQIELWATYQVSTRLGRRVAWGSDNKEMLLISFPVSRVQMPVKPRKSSVGGCGGGAHHPRCDIFWCHADVVGEYGFGHRRRQAEILGVTTGKPRAKVFDTSFGQPLFWAERKTVPFWQNLFEDLDASMIIDCSPGSGSAAKAALQANIPYFGFARNDHHASFLCNVVDRQALSMMRTAGSPLHHQDMAECISAHFSQLIASMQTMDAAKDTCPDGEVTLEELAEEAT